MAEECTAEASSGDTQDPPVPRLSVDGYGLEVQGYDHRIRSAGEATVFLPRDTVYRIRLSNSNDHVCMGTIQLDGYTIGTFLLHPYTKCDIERPTDRPLGFTFLQTPVGPLPPPAEHHAKHGKAAQAAAAAHAAAVEAAVKKSAKSNKQLEKTEIVGIFKPEAGGKILQVDVSAEHLNKTERLELVTDTTVNDLFEDISRDFGGWVMQDTSVLIHWTTAEYDSPVEDILSSTHQTTVRSFRRTEDPIRKMSLVTTENVELLIDGRDPVTYAVDALATFEKAIEMSREALKVGDRTTHLYFLSASGRHLCSTQWIKDKMPLLIVMHKDEVLAKPGTIVMRVALDPDPLPFLIITRHMNHGTHELHVIPETTIRECRAQLESVSGPWGDDPRWLFGGTLLENRRNIGYYGITDHSIVDIVPRLGDMGTYRSLEMRDPIAVDGDKPVNTAEMIKREESKTRAAMSSNGGKKKKTPFRGGTTLRGKTKQQYIEVDPIETDERFIVPLSIAMFPKDKEEEILRTEQKPQKVRGKTCTIS